MANFTPGPWESASRTGDDWDSVIYLPNKLGYEVCQCFHGRGNEEECEANAHLISAAPELYAIAKIVAQEMGIEDTEHYDALMAAIAKAEGR